jgi:multidrug efflux pump subunit AcrA (membrane-fusion protein)
MFVSLRILTSQRLGVPVVPKKAVRLEGRRALIYRVEAGVAFEVRFVPGLEDTDRVEVTGGALEPGDRVVLVGVEQLTDGARVEEALGIPEAAD